MEQLERLIDGQLRMIDQVPDVATRAQMASSLLHRLGIVTRWVAGSRSKMILELRRDGHGASDIGRILGVTRQQAHRLLREAIGKDYRPEDNG